MAKILLVVLKMYQRYVSPLKAPSCRFVPSCSEYAREAVIKYGARKGGWLALKRIARCNPFCRKTGYDPVP